MIPWMVRKLLFPLHERVIGRPTFARLAELEETQWLSREEMEALQFTRLKALLASAVAHSPWHATRIRAAGIDLDEDRPALTAEDLRRLPTMTRDDARENREALVWHGVPGGAQQYNTGGSSGQPLIFYFGRSRQAADAASRMRARRWWNVEVGDREVFLWGAPVELGRTDRIKTLRDRLFNQLLLNAFEMSLPRIDAYIEAIRSYRPRVIYGYASSLSLLAARARDRGADLRSPTLQVICTTGEPLYAESRTLLEEVFQVPVATEWGSRDAGLIAHQSPAGQALVMSDSLILEVLDADGSPVPPGQMGEAVLTGLCSEAQPFIRYRSGDMVIGSADHCQQGRGLEVIAEVVGRQTDFVVRSDGTIMHALALIYVLRAVEGVGEFKLIQHDLDEIEVLIVPGAAWGPASSDQIVAGLQGRLGESLRVTIEVVESIPPEASGKHRYVVSRVPLPASLHQG